MHHGLLAQNNEYADEGLLFPDGVANWDEEKTNKSLNAHDVSIIEIRRGQHSHRPRWRSRGSLKDSDWHVVRPSKYARRITGQTPMRIGGPAAGDDRLKTIDVATLASFDFQSKKEDSETRVGNTMILEGGVGGDFLRGGLTAGLAYYSAIKLSDDELDGIPGIVLRGKNKVFALGPEVTLALARKGVLYGFFKVSYQWEVYARTTTQGGELTMTATFPMRPIKLP